MGPLPCRMLITFLVVSVMDYFRRSVTAKRLTSLISYHAEEIHTGSSETFIWAPPIIPITRAINARAVRLHFWCFY